MKTCSILIPSMNAFEAVQLAVESIHKFTRYPGLQIIVYDDASENDVDLPYLREARDKGLITQLIEGRQHVSHGGALNILLNQVCETDLAVVMDCDVQIKTTSWIEPLIGMINKPDILGVCDFRHEAIRFGCYTAGFYKMWFGLLNMAAYRDGMQVDWRYGEATREAYPFNQMFTCLDGIVKPPGFNENLVKMDPGSKLWVKIRYDNPKRYRMLFLPKWMNGKFHHYGHISMSSIPQPQHSDQVRINREVRFAQIKEELRRLRCQVKS